MVGALLAAGFEIISDARQADLVIINTCAFIGDAQQESVDTILETAAYRKKHRPQQALLVAGCLPQRFRAELPHLIPEVDAVIGVDQVPHIAKLVQQTLSRHLRRQTNPAPWVEVTSRPVYMPDHATPRFRLTPKASAYLKIAEGCNHPCSFCLIPRLRGRYRSRPLEDLLAEARQLIAAGVRELNLISQDTTYYGMDRQRTAPELTGLPRLLGELNALRGNFWIRLLYTHPAHWTEALIAALVECRKVVRYVDLPLQHVHPTVLQRMRRETTANQLTDLVQRLRNALPGVTLRTTFIVGFPGETEAHFDTLLAFVRQTRFERLGVFLYSPEDGTRAVHLAGAVPESVKIQRRDRLMAEQQSISRQIAASHVGQTLKMLVEHPLSAREWRAVETRPWESGGRPCPRGCASCRNGSGMVGRGTADAPDVDGRIYVRGRLAAGEFTRVRIVGHTAYDLMAEPIKPMDCPP